MDLQNNKGEENVRKFLRGVWSNPNKKVARFLTVKLALGRWNAIMKLAKKLEFPGPFKIKDLKAVLDPNGKLTDSIIFRNRLMVNPKLRAKLTRLPKDNFQAVAKLAKEVGLDITKQGMRAANPKRFH